MSAPHHQPKLEISAWLDREAARFSEKATRDPTRAERLREAAAMIRSLRAELIYMVERRGRSLTVEERNADYADQLTNMIGVYFGVDHGEHSNMNEPWENAIETMRVEIGKRQSPEKTDDSAAGQPQGG